MSYSSDLQVAIWKPRPLRSELRFFGSVGPDQRVNCEWAARVPNVSCHLAVVASDVMLDSEPSEQSSSIGHGRLFPTPFGRSNHHSSDSDSFDMLEKTLVLHVCSRGRA